ncbi:MAG TPA: hypothetical protein VK698_29100 [Kofleriaceae bacterium]|nr:hypothetical protein [Kofleriaceae bacterium]
MRRAHVSSDIRPGKRSVCSSAVLLAAALLTAGCQDRDRDRDRPGPAPSASPAARLTDLGASLDPIRSEFNAHRSEARFLTLLAPT